MELNDAVIRQLARPIEVIWNYIYPDAVELVDCDEDCIELCIDADRLLIFGYDDSHSLVRSLISEHGYQTVLKFLSNKIRLY